MPPRPGAGGGEDGALGSVGGDNGEDRVGGRCDGGELGADARANLGSELLRGGGVAVINGGDGVALFFEATGHVGAHAADADECDGRFHFMKEE